MGSIIKVHFSSIRRRGIATITGTLCNRMSNAGDDINCTTDPAKVTCKFCIKLAKEILKRIPTESKASE